MDMLVHSNTELSAALAAAQSGDTIQLASGSYSAFGVRNLNFSGAGVTITSQDPNNPAQVAGIEVNSSSGVTISHLDLITSPRTMYVVQVQSSSDIHLDHLELHQNTALGDVSAQGGLLFRSDTNVSITNSNFHDLAGGPRVLTSSDVVMSGNTFSNIHGDGIQVTSTSHVTVDGNYFTNFIITNPLAHPDAIQFFTTNQTTPATDITVTNNVLVRGTGSIVQGVFMGNENKIPYENVVISGNTIVGGMYNGIAIGYGKNVQITDNIVQGYADMNSWIYWNHIDGGTVANNQATFYQSNTNTGMVVLDNGTLKLVAVGDTSILDSAGVVIPPTTTDPVVTDPPPTDPVVTDPPPVTDPTTPDPGTGTDAGTGTGSTGSGSVGTPPPPTDPTTPPPTTDPSAPPTSTPDPNAGKLLTATAKGGSLTGTELNDTINGDVGKDNLAGSGGHDQINGSAGNDRLDGGSGNDTLSGGADNDTVTGGQGHDLLSGDTGNDQMQGNDGNDTALGGDGADTIYGGQGDDVVYGGAGADWLSGDKGNDTLTGGAGADIFHAGKGAGIDRITDFNYAEGDRIQLDNGVKYKILQVASDTVIDMGNGDQVVLANVQASSLPHGWII